MKSEKLVVKTQLEKQRDTVIQAYDVIITRFKDLGIDEQYLNRCRAVNPNIGSYPGTILFGKLGLVVRCSAQGVRYDFFAQPKRSAVSLDKFHKAPPPESWCRRFEAKYPAEFVSFMFEYLSNQYYGGTVHAKILLHAVLQNNPQAVTFLKQLQVQGVMQRHHIVHMFTCHLETSLKFLK